MHHHRVPFCLLLLLLLFVVFFYLFFLVNNNNNNNNKIIIMLRRGIQQQRRPFFTTTNAWVLKSVVVVPMTKKTNTRRTTSRCQLHHPAFGGGAGFSSPRCFCRLASAYSSSTKRFLSSTSTSSTTSEQQQQQQQQHDITTATVATSNEQSTEEDDIDKNDINTIYYNELKLLSNKIRYHDDLYYNSRQQESPSSSSSSSSSADDITITNTNTISDEEYDALVDREEWICINYPSVLQKWEYESGLGKAATRYGGQRVGAVVVATPTSTFTDEDANNAVVAADTEPSSSTTSATKQTIKRKHLQKMLSLDNVHTTTELLSWMGRIRKKLLLGGVDNDINDEKATTGHNNRQNNNNTTHNNTHYNITIVTEPKLDGLGLSLRYAYTSNDDDDDYDGNDDDGIWSLRWASTRGDGKQGLDVTAAVRDMQQQQQQQQGTHSSSSSSSADEAYYNYYYGGVPQTLPQQNNEASVRTSSWLTDHGVTELEVRGEVVFPNTAFELLKNNNNERDNTTTTTASDDDGSSESATARTRTGTYSNARNAAAGILLRKDEQTTNNNNQTADDDNNQDNMQTTKYLRSQLRFYAYEIVFGIDDDETSLTNNDDGDHHPNINNNNPLDNTRSLLETWGFAVPQPSIETNLTISTATAAGDEDDEDDEDDARLEWNESDISATMLNYYNQLQLHREQQQQQQQGLSNAGENYGILDHSIKTPPQKTVANSESTMQLQWDDYDMDGCVHKIGQANLRRIVGASARTPRWAIAHKFPSHLVVTSLQNVTVQVGRTGALTPVAELQPVEYNGVIISRATLHNFQHLQQVLLGDGDGSSDGDVDRRQIPKGALVMVRRAGDVIPQVVSRVYDDDTSREEGEGKEDSNKDFISLDFPEHCPACGSDTVFENISKGNTSSNSTPTTGQILRCGGPALLCPPRAALALQHAYSRDAIEIKGLSEARIRQLMDAGLLKIPSDIFQLVNDPQQLKKLEDLEGWGPKSVQNLAATTRVASEGVSLARFIYSLGIRYAGVQTSELIAAVYGNVDAFLKDLEEAPAYEMSDKEKDDDGVEGPDTESFSALREENDLTKGLGPVLLKSLVAFSKEKDLVNATRELSKSLLVIDHPQAMIVTESLNDGGSALNKPLQGMSVVFTGSVLGLTRKLARQVAKELGAKSTPTTLSKATNLIVIGERGGSKKLEQAESLGVRTMDAKEFQEMVDEHTNK